MSSLGSKHTSVLIATEEKELLAGFQEFRPVPTFAFVACLLQEEQATRGNGMSKAGMNTKQTTFVLISIEKTTINY